MHESKVSDIAPRILSVVQDLVKERGIAPLSTDEENLRAHGLTSLDMVKLVLLIEAEFDFMLTEADMTPTNFESVATIAAMVTRSLRNPK